MNSVCANTYNTVLIWITVDAHMYVHFLIYMQTYICMTHILTHI